jgi:dethiobiotin synthetase
MRTLFITGSGTEVGKTYVTACLIATLKSSGRRVEALKPIATGFDAERPDRSDAAQLLRAAGQPATLERIAAINPWRYPEPISPDMAATRAGRPIGLDELVSFCRAPRAADFLFIEGIGGLMTPLGPALTVLDWLAALRTPVLLVVGSYLGTLSHALTAAGMLAARTLPLEAIVVSESLSQPVAVEETVAALARLQTAPVLAWPRGAERGPAEAVLASLAAAPIE